MVASQLPKFYQTRNSCPQWAPGGALAAASLDAQLAFRWEFQSPAQVAAISGCFIAQAGCPGQNIGGGWSWPAPGNPKDQYTQWTATDHIRGPPPCPCTADLHKGQRLVVSSQSQSLQLTGLRKSFPLICQQQSRLNYKRRVYSAHMKGVPWVIGEVVPLDPVGHLLQ